LGIVSSDGGEAHLGAVPPPAGGLGETVTGSGGRR